MRGPPWTFRPRLGGFAVDFHFGSMFSPQSLRAILRTAPFIGDGSDEDDEPRPPSRHANGDRDASPAQAGGGRARRASPSSRRLLPLRDRDARDDDPGNVCSFVYRLAYLLAMFLLTLFLWTVNARVAAPLRLLPDALHAGNGTNVTRDGLRAKFSASCGVERGLWVPLKGRADSEDEDDDGEQREPYYTSYCPFVESGLSDCRYNGRRDFGYQNWRWQPFSCELPRVDAFQVLEQLRNRKFAFVGDSIAGNQFKSFVCILYGQARVSRSGVTTEVKRTLPAAIRSLDKTITTIRFLRWNATVVWFRSNHLVDVNYVRTGRAADGTEGDWVRQIRYDRADPFWAREAKSPDYLAIVFVAHHHFVVPRGATDLPDYRRALETAVRWVRDQSLSGRGQLIFFQTPSARHWLGESGTCRNQTQPILDPGFTSTAEALKIRIMDEVVPPSVATVIRVTRLTDMRPDGHPSVWRMNSDGVSEDCSHFCLPGVLDSVNEVVVANFLLKLKGASRAA
ncbi:GDSL/SGNH-like acyl-esterase family found in Pmr5 and Cas1p-domain-containing protein [Hyaloraphidium curvatum]|nr:GDSL/SGNH-like acyl-esterase family found in Pmr5 and Cas1p-domain-containing protein [Hyaloraphidium curvatum]